VAHDYPGSGGEGEVIKPAAASRWWYLSGGGCGGDVPAEASRQCWCRWQRLVGCGSVSLTSSGTTGSSDFARMVGFERLRQIKAFSPKWSAVICPTEPVESVIADDPSISGLWSAIMCSIKRKMQVGADHFGKYVICDCYRELFLRIGTSRRGRDGVHSKHFDACGPSSRALARRDQKPALFAPPRITSFTQPKAIVEHPPAMQLKKTYQKKEN